MTPKKAVYLMASTKPSLRKDTEYLKQVIRTIPDFPIKGIQFFDITTLLLDPPAFRETCDRFYDYCKDKGITKVAGVESRGFIFGGVLAYQLGVGFVPIRKPGKLPYKTISEEYELQYGKSKVEVHEDAIVKGDRVVVVDDLIATGGTAAASVRLIERLGGEVVACAFVIDLPELGGLKKIEKYPVFTLINFEGS